MVRLFHAFRTFLLETGTERRVENRFLCPVCGGGWGEACVSPFLEPQLSLPIQGSQAGGQKRE